MRAWTKLWTWETHAISRLVRRLLKRKRTTVLAFWMASSRWAPLLQLGMEVAEHGAEAVALGRAQDLHVRRVQRPINLVDPTGQSKRCSC